MEVYNAIVRYCDWEDERILRIEVMASDANDAMYKVSEMAEKLTTYEFSEWDISYIFRGEVVYDWLTQ